MMGVMEYSNRQAEWICPAGSGRLGRTKGSIWIMTGRERRERVSSSDPRTRAEVYDGRAER